LIHGQQLAALDIHERRGHHEELAGDLEIELAHHLDVFDELRGELGEIDRIDVHLLLLDEIEEQIQRAFKDLEFDFVFGHSRAANQPWPRGEMLAGRTGLAMTELRASGCPFTCLPTSLFRLPRSPFGVFAGQLI